MNETDAVDEDPATALRALLNDLDATSDGAIGGPAAAARTNARRTAAYFLAALQSKRSAATTWRAPIPGKGRGRHHRPRGQQVQPAEFRHQFLVRTDASCARAMVAAGRSQRVCGAMLAADAKAPADRRVSHLERENPLLRAEVEQLRSELAQIRGIVARTGRLP